MSAQPEVIQMPIATAASDPRITSMEVPNQSSLVAFSEIITNPYLPSAEVMTPSLLQGGSHISESDHFSGGPAKRMRIEIGGDAVGPSEIDNGVIVKEERSEIGGETETTAAGVGGEGEEVVQGAYGEKPSGSAVLEGGAVAEGPIEAASAVPVVPANSMDLLVSAALACDDEILLWDKHKAGQSAATTQAGSSAGAVSGAQPDIEIVKMFRRLSGIHTPRTLATAELRWCVVCNDRRPRVCCVECGVGLCTNGSGKDNCWSVYHTEERYVMKKAP